MLQRITVTRDGWLAAIAVGASVAGLSINSCLAQCVDSTERVPVATVQLFESEPSALLQVLRNSRDKLAGRLTGILVTDPKLLPSVAKLVSDAPTDDRPAIGTALRQAELLCIAAQPEVARKINDFVRKLGDRAVTAGYFAVTEQPGQPGQPAVDNSSGGNTNKPLGKPTRSPARPNPMMTGEWKTELSDPFESVPLPE